MSKTNKVIKVNVGEIDEIDKRGKIFKTGEILKTAEIGR